MITLFPRMVRHAGFLLGLLVVAALGCGLTTAAHAAHPDTGITAAFDASTGVLTVTGDEEHNSITISRDAAGTILVNGGAVPVAGGPSTLANTTLIDMFGLGNDDQLVLDPANGQLPKVRMSGGAGNDTLTARAGIGRVSGEVESDRIAPDPGAAGDSVDGGDGTDTVVVTGSDAAEIFTATAGDGRVRVERPFPHPFTLDIGAAEVLALTTNDGDDRFAVGAGVDQVVTVTVDGRAMAAGEAVVESGSGIPLQGNAGISASYSPVSQTLTIFGTALDDAIIVGRKAAGNILVNGGSVNVLGGKPTVANTSLIQAFGQGGNDKVALDEAKGGLPKANLFGSTGDDTLTGGTGADLIFGQAGNDTSLGKGGVDQLFGGADNDILAGGDENDQVYGESGLDRLVWKAGDDSDVNEGGADSDTVEVNGVDAAEAFTATANGTRVRFDRVNPEPFFLDIGTAEHLLLNAKGGDDTFSATGNLAALIQIAVEGGAGMDTLLGSNGADTLSGGDGNDTVDGQQGNDVALLGKGEDTFQWDPGDGNDTVEGQAGSDTLRFNGSAAAETFDAAANGERLRFARNVANIVMDVNDVETVDLHAAGGADILTIHDLTGADLAKLNVNLAGTIGGTGGDAQPDRIVVRGTNRKDVVDILSDGTGFTVGGLRPLVAVSNAEGASDRLVVETLDGDDILTAGAGVAGAVKLTAEGGLGADTLNFNASGDDERVDIAANGERVVVFRNPAAVAIDLSDMETVDLNAGAGADTITVGDVSGTDLTAVRLNIAAAGGHPDSVFVNGTNGFDVIKVSGSAGGGVQIAGLPAGVSIKTLQGANNALTVNALDGADQVNAGALAANLVRFAANGGLGTDTLFGSQGNDVVNGNDGEDLAMLGGGDDTFVWNPGDDNDVLEGQAGSDTLVFNGANANEQIAVSANGKRVRFTRDVAAIAMDLKEVETITFHAGGGTDSIVVGDLSGTEATEVNLDLAAFGGAGDTQLDSVFVNATNGGDAIVASGNGNGTTLLGLAAKVNITGSEVDNDRLTVSTLAGDDVVDASGLAEGAIQLTVFGGDNADELLGGDNADVLSGEDGDDVLRGGPGVDVLDGGPGNNVVIQD